jgi:hypothetical protein
MSTEPPDVETTFADSDEPTSRTETASIVDPRVDAPRRRPSESTRATRVLDRMADAGLEAWVTFGIVAACVVFTFTQLQPELIFRNTTPNGGDMGAHVWAPAYLRDHLLPDLRLTGWTPDWYAGFPALRFYMVPPMLAIVALDVVLPYGIAFKVVAVSGALALPVACWAFGRLARVPFPGPALFAVGSILFLFSTDFSIYGGNLPSTLAGEFSFSISLSLAVLYLGLLVNGLQTGRHRGWAALVIGMCALTHVIPLIFAIVATAVIFAVYPSRRGLTWLLTTAPVGALLSMWWLLPFWWQRAYLNDMGWEKLVPPVGSSGWEAAGFWFTKIFPNEWRWARDLPGTTVDLRLDIVLVLLVGVAVPLVRRSRLGVALIALMVVGGLAIWLTPQGRLWNARLIPFEHLVIYLSVGLGVALLIRWYAELFPGGWKVPVRTAGAMLALGLGLFWVALPLRALPFFGETQDDGTYRWLFVETADNSYIPGWARWNFRGYEGKDAWPEYEAIVATMADLGATNGCGRSMWEYSSDLDRYGTPMALMLLPYWTDGCIGSMEGLYFESSSTTPYHFLNQSALSAAPSRPQRGLTYPNLDVPLGVAQLQMSGVRYYMAQSDEAIAAASQHPDLTEVARSGPWVVYEVADAPLVVGLANEPAVLDRAVGHVDEWLEQTEEWWNDPTQWDVHLAADGPDGWQRVDEVADAEAVPVADVEVTNIEAGDSSLSFDVSDIGTPVLVRTSYFPNWGASGAEGPWRISPNFMVVVPTDTHVELSYGRAPVELLGIGLTLVGVVGLILLFRAGPLVGAPPAGAHSRTDDGDSPVVSEP